MFFRKEKKDTYICVCFQTSFYHEEQILHFFLKKNIFHRSRYKYFFVFLYRERHKKMDTIKDCQKANELLKLENQLCFRLYTAARLTVGAYHPYLDPLGITYPQYLVLLVLWEKDNQPVCDIAKTLLLDTNTVTPLLQRMEKAGVLTRTKGKTDTRQRIVSLTRKGKAMHDQAKQIPDCLRRDVAMKMGDEEEILQMIPTLDKLIEGLKRTNKQ